MTPTTDTADQITSTAARITELQDHANQINDEIRSLKIELAALLPVGSHKTAGVTVTISSPSRRFNTDRAWSMLTPEQQAICVSPDPKKIKAQLPGTLVDACMDPGKGDPVIKIGA